MGPFEKKLNELLNTPVKWEWSDCHRFTYCARFEVAENHYHVTFDDAQLMSGHWARIPDGMKYEPLWKIEFDMDWNWLDTGTGNATTVLATVIDVVQAWEQKAEPNFIYVAGSDAKRSDIYRKVYRRMFSRDWLTVFDGPEKLVIARKSYLEKFGADERDIAGLKSTKWF